MSRASFTWKGDEWARSVLPQAVATGLNAAAATVQGEFGRALQKGAKPSAPGSPPRVKHGRQQGSLLWGLRTAPAAPGRFKAAVYNLAEHARMLELGGTIKPLTHKYLTIPLNKRAELLRERNKDLSVFKGALFRSKAGNLILVIREGKGDTKGGGDAVFVLKERVTIAPRPWFRPVFARSREKMLASMKRAMRAQIVNSFARPGAQPA